MYNEVAASLPGEFQKGCQWRFGASVRTTNIYLSLLHTDILLPESSAHKHLSEGINSNNAVILQFIYKEDLTSLFKLFPHVNTI